MMTCGSPSRVCIYAGCYVTRFRYSENITHLKICQISKILHMSYGTHRISLWYSHASKLEWTTRTGTNLCIHVFLVFKITASKLCCHDFYCLSFTWTKIVRTAVFLILLALLVWVFFSIFDLTLCYSSNLLFFL